MLLGLVTGNIEAAAHIKLARGRLNRFFTFGGYGSDSADRTEVTEAALARGALVSGGTLTDGACIAVGDTPRDVDAGHGAGIKVVGVATGSYSVEQLASGRLGDSTPGLVWHAFPEREELPVRDGASGQRAARLVDGEEAGFEAVAGGAQVEAPDADPFGPGQAHRLVEVLVQPPGPVAQGLGVVGAEAPRRGG